MPRAGDRAIQFGLGGALGRMQLLLRGSDFSFMQRRKRAIADGHEEHIREVVKKDGGSRP